MCRNLYAEQRVLKLKNEDVKQMEFYWRPSSVSLVGVTSEVEAIKCQTYTIT
jgi:hypothetical protein